MFVGMHLFAASGPASADTLAEALGSKSLSVRLAAARALAKLGKAAGTDATIKALNAAIGDDAVRVDAAAALVAIGASAKAAVPGLIEVGFSSNTPNMQRAIRFPSAGWRDAQAAPARQEAAAVDGSDPKA